MKCTQRGITLIETMGAVAVGSMMLLGLTAVIDTSLEDLEGQQAALYQAQVVAAARKYIAANYQALIDATPDDATVVPITIDALKAQDFLPAGFALRTPFNQATCILVRQPAAAGGAFGAFAGFAAAPPPVGSGKLDALVVTSGGQRIEDRNIAAVAANAGQGSGYIARADPTTARGASWSLATDAYRGVNCPDGGAPVLTGEDADGGHLVSNLFYDGPGQLATDFLYRHAVPGRPELNNMHTPIRMSDSAVVSEGDACGEQAAIAANASRDILRCGGDGLWSYMTPWKKPVDTYAALPKTDKAGEVRMVRDIQKAFVYDASGGGKWVALAVDQNGDLAVGRDANVGRNVNASNEINAYNVNASNEVNAYNVNAEYRVHGRYLRADRTVVAYYTITESVNAPGEACHLGPYLQPDGTYAYLYPVGSMVVDGNGLLMSCYSDYTFRYNNGTYSP